MAEHKTKTFTGVIIGAGLVVVVFWIVNLTVILYWDWWCALIPTLARVEPGTFGDTFGAVNALFSALAFSLLIWTSMMQREELRQNTKSLEVQAIQMTEQSVTMRDTLDLQRNNLELLRDQMRLSVMPIVRNEASLVRDVNEELNTCKLELRFTVLEHPVFFNKGYQPLSIGEHSYELKSNKLYVTPGQYFTLTEKTVLFGEGDGSIEFADKIGNTYRVEYFVIVGAQSCFLEILEVTFVPK